VVQLRGEGEDEGGDRLALAGRCLLPPGFLSISPLSPGLSLSSPSSSVPGICCLQMKMAVWKGCSTNTASSFRLFSLWLFFSSALFPSFVFSGLSFLFLFPCFLSISLRPGSGAAAKTMIGQCYSSLFLLFLYSSGSCFLYFLACFCSFLCLRLISRSSFPLCLLSFSLLFWFSLLVPLCFFSFLSPLSFARPLCFFLKKTRGSSCPLPFFFFCPPPKYSVTDALNEENVCHGCQRTKRLCL